MDYPKPNPKLAWRKLGEQTIVLELGERRYLHELNEIASSIWHQLDGQKSLEQIAGSIVEEYEIDYPRARADTDEFLDELHRQGLIEWQRP